MVRQAVLPFKLKRTDEQTAARSGLTLYVEFLKNREDHVREASVYRVPLPDLRRHAGCRRHKGDA